MAAHDTASNQDEHSVTNLAAIVGRWKIEKDRTVFQASGKTDALFGICVSNDRLLDGEARVKIRRPNHLIESRILLGYRSMDHEFLSVGLGGGARHAYAVVHFTPGLGWRPLAAAGSEDNFVAGQQIEVCVKVRGQRILLEADGVQVLEYVLSDPLPYGQLGLFTWGEKGEVEFTDFRAKTASRGDVFVVMQFSGFEELWKDVIEPVTKEFRFRPYRADQVYGPGSIIQDIIRGIETAQIIIAEITPANENVFYEVGYAHALKKPTILLVDEKREKLPFDLSGFRCLFYQNSIGGKRKVEEGLRKYLRAILDE